jgi:DeoR/GlpR family transcriptional regulator of sugar metabolism
METTLPSLSLSVSVSTIRKYVTQFAEEHLIHLPDQYASASSDTAYERRGATDKRTRKKQRVS